jgi:hypothetical protein
VIVVRAREAFVLKAPLGIQNGVNYNETTQGMGPKGSAMIYARYGTLRHRQINALSWRVASELSRRDAGVYLGLTYDGGSEAHGDALVMTSGSGAWYSARRCGLGFTAGEKIVFELPWDEALTMPTARAIAVTLEESLGIHRPAKSPPTSLEHSDIASWRPSWK